MDTALTYLPTGVEIFCPQPTGVQERPSVVKHEDGDTSGDYVVGSGRKVHSGQLPYTLETFCPRIDMMLARIRLPTEAILQSYHNLRWRSWQSRRYQKYRSNSGEKDNSKWYDEREEAFWMAIARWPWHDRGQQNSDVPLKYRSEAKEKTKFGRNELVGDTINMWLGLEMDKDDIKKNETTQELSQLEIATKLKVSRKQISSKLQVLRPFYADELWEDDGQPGGKPINCHDPVVYSALKDKKGMSKSRGFPSTQQRHDLRAARHGSSTRHLRHRNETFRAPARESRPALRPLPISVYGEIPKVSSSRSVSVTFHEFQMNIRDNEHNTLHKYTSMPSKPLGSQNPDTRLDKIPGWEEGYPRLAYLNRTYRLRCVAIAADSVLDTSRLTAKNGSMEIVNTFATEIPLHDENCELLYCTQYYEGAELVREFFDKCPAPWGDDGKFIHELPLGSDYWAKKFNEFEERRAFDPRSSINEVTRAKVEQDISMAIKNIRAVQMMIAVPKNRDRKLSSGPIGADTTLSRWLSELQPEQAEKSILLIVNWKFRQTKKDEAAMTTWRNLILPTYPPTPDTDDFNVPSNLGCSEHFATPTLGNTSYLSFDNHTQAVAGYPSTFGTSLDTSFTDIEEMDVVSAMVSLAGPTSAQAEGSNSFDNISEVTQFAPAYSINNLCASTSGTPCLYDISRPFTTVGSWASYEYDTYPETTSGATNYGASQYYFQQPAEHMPRIARPSCPSNTFPLTPSHTGTCTPVGWVQEIGEDVATNRKEAFPTDCHREQRIEIIEDSASYPSVASHTNALTSYDMSGNQTSGSYIPPHPPSNGHTSYSLVGGISSGSCDHYHAQYAQQLHLTQPSPAEWYAEQQQTTSGLEEIYEPMFLAEHTHDTASRPRLLPSAID